MVLHFLPFLQAICMGRRLGIVELRPMRAAGISMRTFFKIQDMKLFWPG